MTPQEAAYERGMATLRKYGRDHYAAISKGRPRRNRFPRKERVGSPESAGARISQFERR